MNSNIENITDPKKKKIAIMFGARVTSLNPHITNYVLIVPSLGGWNDFGYRTRVDIHIRLDTEEQYSTWAFIGFIPTHSNDTNGLVRLEELLSGVKELILPAHDSHRFFTMLPFMDTYRKIVQKFGVNQAIEILVGIKDITALNEFRPSLNWLELAVQTDIFQKSFIRNSESYFAYKNAASILRGLELEKSHKLPKTISINFQLPGRLNAHELSFRFDLNSEIPKQIAVIIGKNGVGKSQTLGRIVRAAIKGDNTLLDGDSGGRTLVNRILAFAPTNEARSVFPNDKRKRTRIWYRRFSLNRSRSVRKENGVADQVLQVARSDEYIGDLSRWSIFLDALKAIENWEQICLPVKNKVNEPIELKTLIKGSEEAKLVKFATIDLKKDPLRVVSGNSYPLSSGEISFLRFAAQASLYVENGSLLLLDEPETHLHPNFISQFVSLLDSLLNQTGSVAIIATHSVYFVREVFREQVTILRNDSDGYLKIERPSLRTFGADIGAISYFVFGQDEPSQLVSKIENQLISRFKTWEELYAEYKGELSLAMLGSLREVMKAKVNNE